MKGHIGIFDSGVGGLTVLREIIESLPGCSTTYLGDTARVPYGIRSARVVTQYALENTSFLVEQGIDALVVACNTAASVALEVIREEFAPLPVLGVVQPGASRAVETTRSGRIAVLATEATIASGAYERAIAAALPGATVTGRACPLFVPLAEEGWVDGPIAEAVARRYLESIKEEDVDTVVLGCTHYPLLGKTIQKVVGDEVVMVDSASCTAQALSALWTTMADGEGSDVTQEQPHSARKFFVTDSPDRFARVGAPFLRDELLEVEHVYVGKG